MYYKWTKQYKRLKLREQIENKRFSMKEIRGQMATYAQGNDEVSREMYQKLLDQSMGDIAERSIMQEKFDRPVEDAELKYREDVEKVKSIANEILNLEQVIEQKQKEASGIKEQLDSLKQEEEEKTLQLQALVDSQLELHGDFTDEDIIQQDVLNEELNSLKLNIKDLEQRYKELKGTISVKQMTIAEKRKEAMDKISLAGFKFNHKMQILGEEGRLPTNVEYREAVFNKMKAIRAKENDEISKAKQEKEDKKKNKASKKIQTERDKIEEKRNKAKDRENKREEQRRKTPHEKRLDRIDNKYDRQQTRLDGDEEAEQEEKPKKDNIFKRIGNWFKNKFKKQGALPEGQKNMTRKERKEDDRRRAVAENREFLENLKTEYVHPDASEISHDSEGRGEER